MNASIHEIEKMLQEIDVMIAQNEMLRRSQIFSVHEWQAAYVLSILILSIASFLGRKQISAHHARLTADEFVILVFLCKLSHVEIP